MTKIAEMTAPQKAEFLNAGTASLASATAADQAAFRNLLVPASTNVAVGTLGDSLTANGGNWPTTNGRNAFQWGSMIGNNYYIANECGVGGYRTDQILDLLLPRVLAGRAGAVDPPWGQSTFAKLGYCFVMAGTNNMGLYGVTGLDSRGRTISMATTLDDLEEMYIKLLGKNITPIACALPPRGFYHKDTQELNAGILHLARYYGLPFVDSYAALVNPANGYMQNAYMGILAGGSYDPVHFNATGAKALGAECARAMSFITNKNPRLVFQEPGFGPIATFYNGFMLVDANADGFPDGWNNYLSGGATTSIVTDSAVLGNVLQVTCGSAQTFFRSPVFTATPGHWYAFSCRVKFAGAGSGPGYGAGIRQFGGDGHIFGGLISVTTDEVSDGDGTFPSHDWLDLYCVQQCPPGAVNNIWAEFGLRGVGSVLSLAQVSVIDLTIGGIPIV